MNTFFPMTGSEADWNAAYYRLEDYFRAMRIVNKMHQSQLILHILEKAAGRHALDPSQNPTVLAMEEARAEMDQWFESILGQRERIAVAGTISLLAVDAPARWPLALLSAEIPPDLQREMQDSEVHAGPDLQVSSMVPRPIDVSPLLETIHLSDAFEKIRWSMTIVAVLVALVAFSFSLFVIMR